MCHCRCKQNIMKVERTRRDKVKAEYEFEDYSQHPKHDNLSGFLVESSLPLLNQSPKVWVKMGLQSSTGVWHSNQ